MDAFLDHNRLHPRMGLLANLMTQGVRPINGDRPALEEAIREHSANGDPYQIGNDITFRDEIEPEVGTSVEQLAIHITGKPSSIVKSQLWLDELAGRWHRRGSLAAFSHLSWRGPCHNRRLESLWDAAGQPLPCRAGADISPR